MNENSSHYVEKIDRIPLNAKNSSIKIPAWLIPILVTGLISAGSTYALLNWRMGVIEKRTDKLELISADTQLQNADIKNDLKWIKESLNDIKRLIRK